MSEEDVSKLEYMFCCIFDDAKSPAVSTGKILTGDRFAQATISTGDVVMVGISSNHPAFGKMIDRFDIALCFDSNGNQIYPVLIRKKDANEIRQVSWMEALIGACGE